MDRLSTGIPGLDKLISDGFLKGQSILYSGAPGTAKTIAAMHFIADGLAKGENCIYISVEQSPNKIIQQANLFGFNFDKYVNEKKLSIIDGRDLGVSLEIDDSRSVKKSDQEKFVLRNIAKAVAAMKATRLVFDSISSYTLGDASEDKIRVKNLFDLLETMEVTSVLISQLAKEDKWFSRDTVSEFMADGIIVFELAVVGDDEIRGVSARKMRGTAVDTIARNLKFTDSGIVVESR